MTDRTITEIPLDELHDSPFNPPNRATLAIDELAASIRAEGRVHSPLLVRPRTAGGFEIVFGHRRRHAAEAAGLATVPAEVRAMSDAEARSAQAAENVQRENLKALEEAEAYQSMIDGDNLTAEDVAKAIGKSRSHVYGRLRLLSLCPQVREALKSGEVQGEVALLIARVGDEKMQGKALQFIRNIGADLEDGGAKSFRRIRELLNEKFTLDLGKAIFNIEAEMLVPSAGNCVTCRKRTGNAPEFADVAGTKTAQDMEADEARLQAQIDAAETARNDEEADRLIGEMSQRWQLRHGMRHAGPMVCTDPDCFEAKKKAHLKAEAARLEREGTIVIAGGKARQAVNAQGQLAEGFIPADGVDVSKAKADLKIVIIQDPRSGRMVEAYRTEDVAAAGIKVKQAKARSAAGGRDTQAHERMERERERRRQEAEHENAARRAILAAVRERAAAQPRSEFDLRMVAMAMVGRLPYDDRDTLLALYGTETPEALLATVQQMGPDELGRLLLDCALVDGIDCDQWSLERPPEALNQAASHYGVDSAAVRQAAAEPVQTPAPDVPPPTKSSKTSKARKPEAQPELL